MADRFQKEDCVEEDTFDEADVAHADMAMALRQRQSKPGYVASAIGSTASTGTAVHASVKSSGTTKSSTKNSSSALLPRTDEEPDRETFLDWFTTWNMSIGCCQNLLYKKHWWEKFRDTKNIHTQDGKILYLDEIKFYWNMIATISGLVAGFTFLATNTRPAFDDVGTLSPSQRSNVYGVALLLAFLVSLSACLWACVLAGYANLAGPEFIGNFVSKLHRYFDIPMFLLVFALAAMFTACVTALGGLYAEYVWWISVCVGGFCLFTLILAVVVFASFTHTLFVMRERGADAYGVV